jgi:hypothetical protein
LVMRRLQQQFFTLGPLPRLAQNEELECTYGEARRGRRLGQMIRTHSLPRERWGEK